MTQSGLPHVSWIEGAPKPPVCDVPWLGTSVVLSDGNVNFCCFSDAVVGSVKTATFDEVWNGPTMRRIRRDLSAQRFPQECQSSSCPLYRGDQLSYLLKRMDGPFGMRATGTPDPHAELRRQLQDSTVSVTASRAGGDQQVTVDLRFSGHWIAADLYLALRSPGGGALRFLPGGEPFALPSVVDIQLSGQTPSRSIVIEPSGDAWFGSPGTYELCAALFVRYSNPNLLSNCYWSTTTDISW